MDELENENTTETFELDFDVISKSRKTIKDHIKASHEVTGDAVHSFEK